MQKHPDNGIQQSTKSDNREGLIRFFRKSVLSWYGKAGRDFPWRKKNLSCYLRVVSEILLQRTRAETVAGFLPDFLRRFPSWRLLAQASLSELEKILRPVGLWRQRAKALSALAHEMVNRRGRFPLDQESLESLPGVGQYVANAIQLLCLKKPRPLLDGNMAKVLERFFGPRKLSDIRYDPYLQKLSLDIVLGNNAVEVNWGILDIAALICRKKPACHSCPLVENCGYGQEAGFQHEKEGDFGATRGTPAQ